MSLKFSKLVLAGYGIILMVSLLVFYTIPDYPAMAIEYPTDRSLYFDVYEMLADGEDPQDAAWIELAADWQQQFEGKSLEITSEILVGDDTFVTVDAMIMIERVDSNDGIIRIREYNNATFYTDRLINHKFQLHGNQLKISRERINLRFVSCTQDFSITQFRPEQRINPSWVTDFGRDRRVIYIQIPRDVEVTIDETVITNYEFLD